MKGMNLKTKMSAAKRKELEDAERRQIEQLRVYLEELALNARSADDCKRLEPTDGIRWPFVFADERIA
jgi:hypothetical protein